MAKMPDALVKRKARTLADLKPGDRAFFSLSTVTVDNELNAYISANAELAPPYDPKLQYGEVWLDEEGKVHVDLKNATRERFERKDVTLFLRSNLILPIETIRWSPDDGS